MTHFYKLNKSTARLIANAGALALIAGMSLSVATPAFADDCLLDTNNDGDADTGVDTDGAADSSGADPLLACGVGASATGTNSSALGNLASAAGSDSTALGQNASASSISTTALGQNASAAGFNSTAVGRNANVNPSTNGAIAVGVSASAERSFSTALGTNSSTTGNGGTAVGNEANVTGEYGTAVGFLSFAGGERSIAVGDIARAAARDSIAVGRNANQAGDAGENSIAVGDYSSARGAGAIAIGGDTNGNNIGANAQGDGSIIIGVEASGANFDGAIVIGEGATATETNQVILKSADTFTILGNGDVGIGTAAPNGTLDVDSGVDDAIFLLTNDTAQWEFKSNAGNGKLTFGNKLTGTKPFKFGPDAIGNLLQVGIVATDQVDIKGNLVLVGTLTTGGPTCGGGCDAVFDTDYDLPSIEEHARAMYANSYLPQVGPTVPLAAINVSERMGTMLNELEKAHIYIAQINTEKQVMQAEITRLKTLEMRVLALEHQGRE